MGADPAILPIVPDDRVRLRSAVEGALAEYDLVLIIAGSSAGSEDFTASVLEEVGEVLVHGVATRPGKPTILGSAAGKPVVGVPGYPVSAYLSLEWFVRPSSTATVGSRNRSGNACQSPWAGGWSPSWAWKNTCA